VDVNTLRLRHLPISTAVLHARTLPNHTTASLAGCLNS